MSDIFEFEDKAKVERLIGTLHDPAATTGDVLTVQADKSIAAQPGGGGSGGVQAVYEGIGMSVGDGSSASLTFDQLDSGTELLDRSDPANPTFLEDGTYAASLVASGESLTSGGYALLALVTTWLLGVSYTERPGGNWSASAVFIASAGDVLTMLVTNHDGATARNFRNLSATIVKLA